MEKTYSTVRQIPGNFQSFAASIPNFDIYKKKILQITSPDKAFPLPIPISEEKSMSLIKTQPNYRRTLSVTPVKKI